MPNKIWHPNDFNSAQWFIHGSSIRDLDWQPTIIPNAGTAEFLNLPESIKRILRLDKPDLIATIDVGGVAVPVVSIEITTTTPQSQHAKQRVPRLIAAAESGVPAIYIIPERKRSGGSIYKLGGDLYFCAYQIQHINQVPVLIYHYPTTPTGDLIHDQRFPNQPNLNSPSIQETFRTIDALILNKLSGNNVLDLYSDQWITQEIQRHANFIPASRVQIRNYNTLTDIQTSDLASYLQNNTQITSSRINDTINALPDRIRTRDRTLIFHPRGRLFEHAGDPYCGMLSFFDYAFCRTGRGVEDRMRNLVYMPMNSHIFNIIDEFCPDGYHSYWESRCPFNMNGVPTVSQQFNISHHLQYGCVFTKIKPLRIYGYFSDMIVFQDSILVF